MRFFLTNIFVFCFLFLFFNFCYASDNLIISQFQVSGASSSTDEFIELYNPTNKSVSLFDYKLQKKSSSGVSYNIVSSFPEGAVIKPFSYFLLSHQNFSLQSYVKPDLVYTNYSIANDNSIVLYDSDSNIIDYVGFGGSSYCEGSCLLNILSNQSYIRLKDYNNYGYGYGFSELLCSDFDSNNNKNDFFILQKSSPRNSNFVNECKYISIKSDNFINNNYDKKDDINSSEFINIFSKNNLKNYLYNTDNSEDLIKKEDVNKEKYSSNENLDIINKYIDYNFDCNDCDNNLSDNLSDFKNIIDINEFQNLDIGQNVSFYGIVASLPGDFSNNFFYLNGVQVYNSKADFPNISIGDKVFVSGEVSSNYGEKRIKIKNSSNISIVSHGNKLNYYDLYNNDFENLIGKMVYFSGNVLRKSSNKIYVLNNDLEIEVYFYNKIKDLYKNIKTSDDLKIFGILSKRNDVYRIIPRNKDDILNINLESNNSVDDLEIASFIDDSVQNKENLSDKIILKNQSENFLNSEMQKDYNIKNNKDIGFLKYFIFIFIFLFICVLFIFLKNNGILLKIKMFFKMILAKIK